MSFPSVLSSVVSATDKIDQSSNFADWEQEQNWEENILSSTHMNSIEML